MNFGLALKVFWKTLRDPVFAEDVRKRLTEPVAPKPLPEAPKPAATVRTEAVELLATLQREARLVDFLMEKLDSYSDAQIGAAVRGIHRDCAKTVQRLFGIEPLVTAKEGERIDLPANPDPGQWKLTGNVGSQPQQGRLCHHGWRITRHELPKWTGKPESAWVIAPAEVEV